MHWPDTAQRHRIAEIRDNLNARIAEAEREGWLGEIEGLKISLPAPTTSSPRLTGAPRSRPLSASACPASPRLPPPQGALMRPAAVTDSLHHDLVMSSLAEGRDQFAVAAAVILDDRILLCGRDTGDFDREWDLPGGMALPGETLTSALDRILACDYGLDTTQVRAYLGSYERVHGEEVIRVFVFTASCADPSDLPARPHRPLLGRPREPPGTDQPGTRPPDRPCHAGSRAAGALPGRWQLTAALRAGSKGMYCDQAATELLIRHGSWLRRDDFTARYILTGTSQAGDITAAIDWEEAITALHAGDLPCSSSEAAILGLAASFATATPVVLRHAITGLDRANLYLVTNAIRDAGGHK